MLQNHPISYILKRTNSKPLPFCLGWQLKCSPGLAVRGGLPVPYFTRKADTNAADLLRDFLSSLLHCGLRWGARALGEAGACTVRGARAPWGQPCAPGGGLVRCGVHQDKPLLVMRTTQKQSAHVPEQKTWTLPPSLSGVTETRLQEWKSVMTVLSLILENVKWGSLWPPKFFLYYLSCHCCFPEFLSSQDTRWVLEG